MHRWFYTLAVFAGADSPEPSLSYTWDINRHLSQRIRFGYCDEGTDEPVQMFRLARAFPAVIYVT